MSIKTYKPTTPTRRHMTVSGFDGVDKHVKPQKELVEVLKKNAGRNSYGRITVRHQGGGNRKKYRIIDFKRNKLDMSAKVLRLEYDPNRSAFIALLEYEDGGEGKSPVGRPGPVTPWGKPALGYKTRKKKNQTDKFIVKRRNAK